MSKKRYLDPKLSVISFLTEDIVSTSGTANSDVWLSDLNWESYTEG